MIDLYLYLARGYSTISPMKIDSTVRSKRTGKTTILLADDHPLLRHSIRSILDEEPDFQIVGEAGDGEEAIRLTNELQPDVVLMDISMPKLDGLEATRRIKASHPNIAVLVLTIHSDDQHIIGILEAGAAGYLTKSVFGEEVVQSIRGVITGEMVLSPSIGQRLLKQAARYPMKPVPLQTGEKLSTRELEIIKLAARGMSNKSIAADLGLTVRTVKGHMANIFSKLYVGSRTEAVIAGLRAGFISIDDMK
ncbi:response regulator [Chloroflexota bacterium]